MIIPKLYGRLGNQCFQIAAAIAHAKTVGTNYRVPYRTADPNVWPTYFNSLPIARGAATVHTYTEKRHCYDPIPLYKDLLIDGYFQSEKYFEHAKREVQKELNLSRPGDGHNFVALHVRRGDYLQYPDQFPVLPVEYYQAAVDYCIENAWDRFKIYSDDIQWCRQNLKLEWWGSYVDYSNCTNPITDFRDMYSAGAFIISNSTFSLFPALLRYDNPLVVAPAEHRWYGPLNSHLETCDLMPKRFVKL
jgi:hypothetical protein